MRLPAPQVGPALEQVRARQRDDVDRAAAAPLEQVVDEVEQARIGEVQVLEDEHDRPAGGEALEERAPRAEQLVGGHARLHAQQGQQRAARSSARSSGSGDPLRDRLPRSSRASSASSSRLEQAGALADHLAQRPEA